jgi:hypothetical protein
MFNRGAGSEEEKRAAFSARTKAARPGPIRKKQESRLASHLLSLCNFLRVTPTNFKDSPAAPLKTPGSSDN